MKKILSLVLCLSLSLMLAGCNGDNYGGMGRRAKKIEVNEISLGVKVAEESESEPLPATNQTVYDLLMEYVGEGKQYTKLTTLKYSEDVSNYHAGVNARQRRTYYDETRNALLMGNYDGTFASINSGYALVESDMWHYSHNDVANISTSNLFAVEKMDHNYTVQATSPNKFFDTLSDLAEAAKSETTLERWSSDAGVYTYNPKAPATIYDSSNYTNGLLKVFQYFAAPMLLLNNGISLQIATIQEVTATVGGAEQTVLLIKLFDSNNAQISEAIVVKGLTMASVVLK